MTKKINLDEAKVVIIGDAGVGKTSTLYTYAHGGKFNPFLKTTAGFSQSIIVKYNGLPYLFTVKDAKGKNGKAVIIDPYGNEIDAESNGVIGPRFGSLAFAVYKPGPPPYDRFIVSLGYSAKIGFVLVLSTLFSIGTRPWLR